MNIKSLNQKLIIEYESTPNPNSLKFYPVGCNIAKGRLLEFKKNSQFINSALARDLLEIPEIESVFYGSDFISISKDPQINCAWEDLRAKIIFIILGHEKAIIDENLFDFPDEDRESSNHEDDDFVEFDECDRETVDQIIELLDEEIRPRIAMDGGDIKLRAYKAGIAYLELRGACSSCPSSTVTLYEYVREFLISMVEKLIDIERI
jgi:Fe-S cluster biogenesis protein NfuA